MNCKQMVCWWLFFLWVWIHLHGVSWFQVWQWQYSCPCQTWRWFCFQSADNSTGWISRQMTRSIRYLPMLCFFKSRQQINHESELLVGEKVNETAHVRMKNKMSMPRNGIKHGLQKWQYIVKRKIFQKLYSPIPVVISFSQRPIHKLTVCQFLE